MFKREEKPHKVMFVMYMPEGRIVRGKPFYATRSNYFKQYAAFKRKHRKSMGLINLRHVSTEESQEVGIFEKLLKNFLTIFRR